MNTKLTDIPAPSDQLVGWACASAYGLRLPADRPWFLAAPPPLCVEEWDYPCRCGVTTVPVRRYMCEDGKGCVYIGQCRRCETIIWSFQNLALPALEK
jgi:hypothetical protein